MKPTTVIKNNIVTIISYLYALLFIYAASSKLLDYENFRIQLAQSPLLGAFAQPVSIAVPVIEFVIAVLLVSPRHRIAGLYSGYTLMMMFTAYIYLTLNYSAFVPCSCGGILEKLGWVEHLWFNIAFVLMGIVAVLLSPLKIQEYAL